MKNLVFLYLQADGQYCWWHEHEIIRGREDELRFIAKRKKLIIIFPLSDAVCLPISIQTNSKSQLLSAAPFALESELITSLDELHFALEPRGSLSTKSPRYIWCVAHEKMQQWQAFFDDLGINPYALVPEAALINPKKQALRLWVDFERVVACQGAASAEFAPNQLDIAIAAFEVPDVLESTDDALLGELPVCRGVSFVHEFTEPADAEQMQFLIMNKSGDDPLWYLSKQYDIKTTVNVLQGSYARAKDDSVSTKKWMVSVVLLVAVLSLHLVYLAIGNYQMQIRLDELNQQIASQYKDLYPKEPTKQPIKKLQQKIKQIDKSNQVYQSRFSLMAAHINHPFFANNQIRVTKISIKDGLYVISANFDDKQLVARWLNVIKKPSNFFVELLPKVENLSNSDSFQLSIKARQ